MRFRQVTGTVTRQELGSKFRAIVGKKFAIRFGPIIGQGTFFWHHAGPPPKNIGNELKVFRSADENIGDKPASKPYRHAGVIQLSASQTKGTEVPERSGSLGQVHQSVPRPRHHLPARKQPDLDAAGLTDNTRAARYTPPAAPRLSGRFVSGPMTLLAQALGACAWA